MASVQEFDLEKMNKYQENPKIYYDIWNIQWAGI